VIVMPTATMPIDILLVEDNPADVRLTREALKHASVPNRLHVARDGVEAMAFLRGSQHGSTPVPDLVLLDLNLPRRDGREVLADIKADERLRHIPVVVLSTSKAEQDVERSYQLCANAFVTKPVQLDEFFDVMRAIEQFWLKGVKLWRP
jgi:CheY-like chemotaxis protein